MDLLLSIYKKIGISFLQYKPINNKMEILILVEWSTTYNLYIKQDMIKINYIRIIALSIINNNIEL